MSGKRLLILGAAVALLAGAAVLLRPSWRAGASSATASSPKTEPAPAGPDGTTTLSGIVASTPAEPPAPAAVEARYAGADLARFRKMSTNRQAKEFARAAAFEKTVLDVAAPSYDRTHAFVELTRLGCLSREAVVAAAALLATVPERSAQRAQLAESLGARPAFPEVQEVLLTRLSADDNEMVRKRAAMSLQAVNTDPRVRAALTRSMRQDPSEFVRKAAQRGLEPPRPPTSK